VVQAPVVEAVARCKRLVSEEQHQRRTAMDQMMAALGGKVDAEERARTAAVSALKVIPLRCLASETDHTFRLKAIWESSQRTRVTLHTSQPQGVSKRPTLPCPPHSKRKPRTFQGLGYETLFRYAPSWTLRQAAHTAHSTTEGYTSVRVICYDPALLGSPLGFERLTNSAETGETGP
jgi:hypothetical protein